MDMGTGHMRSKNHNNQPRQPNRQATPQHRVTATATATTTTATTLNTNNNLGTRTHKTPTLDAQIRRRTRLYNKPHIAETTDNEERKGDEDGNKVVVGRKVEFNVRGHGTDIADLRQKVAKIFRAELDGVASATFM